MSCSFFPRRFFSRTANLSSGVDVVIFTFSGTQVRIAEHERLQSLFKMSMVCAVRTSAVARCCSQLWRLVGAEGEGGRLLHTIAAEDRVWSVAMNPTAA